MARELIHDDCLTWLRNCPAESIHCCVTDAPYGLKFMGKKWDYNVPSIEIWQEVLRVLKPGGTLLCFAGSRTQHRMAVNIEDADFKLCDTLLWLYGQGFPKTLDIGKQLDKKAGAMREVVGKSARHVSGKPEQRTEGLQGSTTFQESVGMGAYITAPASDAAKQWDGWKSHALKPAYEPIILAMRPNAGSYADNALAHGVAGLHIEACRVPGEAEYSQKIHKEQTRAHFAPGSPSTRVDTFVPSSVGRYPANILHDGSDDVLAGFPNVKAGKAIRHRSGGKNCHSDTKKPPMPDMGYGDDGSAARFFYVAKANKKERGEGNAHPTVKPLALMQWLVRLVCPPNGIVLDPFMGSGTTGVACREEGFEFIGIERELESYETAVRRCKI